MSAPTRDPGLQPERTRLAWRRTTLSAAVVGALAVRLVTEHGNGARGLAAVSLVGLAWLALLLLAHFRIRALTSVRPPLLSPRTAFAAAGCVFALAAFGVIALV
ncbi:DUF202 domain-containing protein [Streptomyces sp. TP-A0874]|uniref:DUF202 domain-containing protein n=1 Tax=Streptomyces sp. TP-A0874 TaxID=549819 RepID=UPI0008539AEF|nr:DUF202 domain-containing protein [Streptomyces sp. TP-A0874]